MSKSAWLRGAAIIAAVMCVSAAASAQSPSAIEKFRAALAVPSDKDALYPELPERFIIATDPPGLTRAAPRRKVEVVTPDDGERPQVVAGQNYTVVTPIYLDGGPSGGNVTYLRLFNFEQRSSTFNITVVGYPSTTILGTGPIVVPSGASRQYSIADILAAASVPLDIRGDSGIAVYMKNVDAGVAFQNVIYNAASKFFENITLCADSSLSDVNRSQMNLHTSRMDTGYPGYVLFHNYSALSVGYDAVVLDSQTGQRLGLFRFTARPNTTYRIPVKEIESFIGFTPNANQFHINLVWGTQSTLDTYRAVVGSLIYNAELGAFINMSQSCLLLH